MKNKVFIINIISLFIFVMSLFAEEESVCPNKTNEACQGDTGSSREAGRESQECESYPSNGVVLDLEYLSPSDKDYGPISKKVRAYKDSCRSGVEWFVRILWNYDEFENIAAVIAANIHNLLDSENRIEMKFVIGTKSSGEKYLFGAALKVLDDTSEFMDTRNYKREASFTKPKNLERFYAIGLYLGLPKEPHHQLIGYDKDSNTLRRTDYYQAFDGNYSDSDYENRDCFRTSDFRVTNVDCVKRHIKKERAEIFRQEHLIKEEIDKCEQSLRVFNIESPIFNIVRQLLNFDGK
jgi:hypothetical protein